MVVVVAKPSHKMEALDKETQQSEASALKHLMVVCLKLITIPRRLKLLYT